MSALLTRPLALTQGDPAGIGPDIALTAWANASENSACRPSSSSAIPTCLQARARLLDLEVPLREAAPAEACGIFAEALPVLPIAIGVDVAAG